jgi:hypothetical protein
VEALRKAGHECVEIEAPDCAYSYLYSRAILSFWF